VAKAQPSVSGFASEPTPLRFWPERETQGDASSIRPMLQPDDSDESARFAD
jgi:hypothetical protein